MLVLVDRMFNLVISPAIDLLVITNVKCLATIFIPISDNQINVNVKLKIWYTEDFYFPYGIIIYSQIEERKYTQ